jgi:hypothetical protein
MPFSKTLVKKLYHFFNKACSIVFISVKIIFLSGYPSANNYVSSLPYLHDNE